MTTPTPVQPLSDADVSLLPCPFCGGEAFERGFRRYECKVCHAEGPGAGTKAEAIAAWNRRPHAPVSRPGDGVEGGEMFGVTGACDEVEALACAIWAHRCPGLLMDEDDDRPHYMDAAKAAFAALDGTPPPAEPVSRPAGEGETTQHTPRCWGRTSYSDEMAHCYCKPAGEGEREAVARQIEALLAIKNPSHPVPGLARELLQRAATLLRPAAPDAGGGEREALALDQLANAAEVVRRLLHKTKSVQGPSFREAGISFTQAIENARHVLKERDALQPGGER